MSEIGMGEITLRRHGEEMQFSAFLVEDMGMEYVLQCAAAMLPEQAELAGEVQGITRYDNGEWWPTMPCEKPDAYRALFTWWQDNEGTRFMRSSEAAKVRIDMSHFRTAAREDGEQA